MTFNSMEVGYVAGVGSHAKALQRILIELGTHEEVKTFFVPPKLFDDTASNLPEMALLSQIGGPTTWYLGIGDNALRQHAHIALHRHGIAPAGFQHPSAIVSARARLGAGVFVGALAYIGPGARIARGAIVNTGALIEHDSYVGPYSHVGPNSTVLGSVRLGAATLVGAGATVLPEVSLAKRTIVGAGSTVTRSVNKPDRVLVGVPAKDVRS